MDLDKNFVTLEMECNCDDRKDGPANPRQRFCLLCKGSGTQKIRISLLDLKALLDGYTA